MAHTFETNTFLKNYFIVVQLQLSAFSSHPSTPTPAKPTPSPASTLPLGFVHVSFIVVPGEKGFEKLDFENDSEKSDQITGEKGAGAVGGVR